MVDITVMDKETQESHKPSTTMMGVLAQACAFMAAPFLTAGVGLGLQHALVAGSIGASIGVPALIGIFAVGAALAIAAVATTYSINKIKQAEQARGVEKSVEHALEKAIIHNQEVSVNVDYSPKIEQKNKNWAEHVTSGREAAATNIQR